MRLNSDSVFLFEESFQRCDPLTQTEDLHGAVKLLGLGERRCDTDVLILGIFAVGEGSARIGELNTDLSAELNASLCSSGKTIEADEIAAVGMSPGTDIIAVQALFKNCQSAVKLGAQVICLLFHMLSESFGTSEEFDMPELIEFIVTQGLYTHLL